MTLLHVYFTLRDQRAFQRLLDRDRSATTNPQASQSASTSKSWTRKNIVSALEVNAFDQLGRTVLHLACSSTEPASLEYVRMLLAHSSINVNLVDKESHWTALHRALYAGNIEVAVMLLKRTDTDTSIKDMEGYTAFDLYNSTIRTADPTSIEDGHAELLTWGVNRNAALGLGDGNDRAYPDHVGIPKKGAPISSSRTLEERFQPVRVRDVGMSKLHTVILTDEPRDNLRLCGFGSGGRLGPFPHTLYTPTPLNLSSYSIVSVALGQDHTLALTTAGEVISWGLNRFAQLGYTVESGHGGSLGESIQTTPRKINHLKKEFVKGIAACKTASACWSCDDVWTWGVNSGQLGYSKTASPVQVLPRKASIITQPIQSIAMSEAAMACLFVTGEVVCVWNDSTSKINFPAHAFPSGISMVYRPPQAIRGPAMKKLACCDELFAALSSNGEVFTFSLPPATDGECGVLGVHIGGGRGQVKPQRVWALRRQFSSIQDIDIGGDGTLIVCTQSGHVFVRSRNLKSSTTSSVPKAFKFQRIAHVQRAVNVYANSTGAFGALRVDYKPPSINVTGRHFSADMAVIAPYISEEANLARQDMRMPLGAIIGADGDQEDLSILGDVGEVAKLMTTLCGHANTVGKVTNHGHHGADLCVRVGTKFETLAHRVIFASRCVPLRGVLGGNGVLHDKSSTVSVTFTPQQSDTPSAPPILHFTGIAPLSLLILLHYLYADEVLAIWDCRLESFFEAQLSGLGFSAAQVKIDLVTLGRLLDLPHLASALQSVGKRVAKPSAGDDFRWLFDQAQLLGLPRRNVRTDPLAPDVALHLADRTVYTHSTVLRARSAFFAAFFTDPDWTNQRRDDAGVIDIEIGHQEWQVMRFVLSFLCFGEEKMFETLEFLSNIDELLLFMFSVISAANELLLTRLVLLCSQVILNYLNAYNACYLLTEAIHFNAVDLADRIQSYMSANAEMLLESRILDDLDPRVLRKLMEHTCADQAAQSPVSRSGKLGREALEKHKEWLALQDIPVPVVPSQKAKLDRDSPRMSPAGSAKKVVGRQVRLYSPTMSPTLRPSFGARQSQQQPMGDEIFAMDDGDGTLPPPLKLGSALVGGVEETAVSGLAESTKPRWKTNLATPRTDLKAIMAEAENGKKQAHVRILDAQGSTASVREKLGRDSATGTGASTSATLPVSAGHGMGTGSSRQPVPTPGQRWPDTPATPIRRVPSGSVPSTPPKPELSPASAPSRGTSTAARTPSTFVQVQASGTGSARSTMGPVITPVRQTLSASGSKNASGSSRKPSLGGAWTLPPVQPIAAPTVPSSTLSFAEIQRMQETQGMTSTSKDKRSLREIQEEEQARQQEADFLKWWTAEEERVRLEMLERERAHAGPGHHVQSKNRGGKTRPRKVQAEMVSQGSSNGMMRNQKLEPRSHRRSRQKEDANE